MILAVLVALFGLVIALSAVVGVEQQARAFPAFAYDDHPHASPATDSTCERGPPTQADSGTVHHAVDRWSDGASVCPGGATPREAFAYDHPATQHAQVGGTSTTAEEQACVLVGDLPAIPGSICAAKTAPQVLKGPIADAVPKNLPQQLALGAAKDGQGTIIMRGLGDTDRLIANYGPGEWVKMQYVMRGNESNVVVHYFRNLTTKTDVEFKFK